MKVRGTTVALIVAGCVLVGSLSGKISEGYFNKGDRDHTTPTNTEQPVETNPAETTPAETITPIVIPEETTIDPDDHVIVQEEVETYTDTFYTRDEFVNQLSYATGAYDINMEEAGSYYIRNRVGWNNIYNAETYNYNDYMVDGKVIYRDGYDVVNGERVYYTNEDNLYDTLGSNTVFFIGDETTIESRRTVNRNGLYAALEFYPEFVENFSTPENFDYDVSLLDEGRNYHYTDTKVLNQNGGLITDRQDFIVDDETIYGVIWDSNGYIESTYGTYSSNYQKGY